MFRIHEEFMAGLDKAIDFLERDITAAEEIPCLRTDEWCHTTEGVLRDIAKFLFCINEPQWLAMEDATAMGEQRQRIDDLYNRYRELRS